MKLNLRRTIVLDSCHGGRRREKRARWLRL
jgi:hypothetical protein